AFSWWRQSSDGTAAVLAVRLLGRVGHHVGLDLLHLATAREELLHGPRQSIALLLLGFYAGQLLDHFGRLGLLARLAAGLGNVAILVVTVIAGVGRFQLITFFFGTVQVVLFQFFVAHVLPHDLRRAGYL